MRFLYEFQCDSNHRLFEFEFLMFKQASFSFQGQNSYSILDIDHFLSDYGEFYRIMNDENLNDTVCVYYAYVSCKLAEHGHNPTSALQVTKTLLQKYPATTDVVLVLIAQTLIDCPAQFLNILLLTCK